MRLTWKRFWSTLGSCKLWSSKCKQWGPWIWSGSVGSWLSVLVNFTISYNLIFLSSRLIAEAAQWIHLLGSLVIDWFKRESAACESFHNCDSVHLKISTLFNLLSVTFWLLRELSPECKDYVEVFLGPNFVSPQ